MSSYTGLLFLIGIILTIAIFTFSFTSQTKPPKHLRQVPGPKGLPIVGNTLSLGAQPQRLFREWALQYGELFKIQLGWENWVFVNSPEAIKEIFDKQSAITSGRPRMPVGSDLVSGGMRFLLMGYTAQWRKLRAVVHKLLTPKMSNTFLPSQEFEAKQLLFDLLTDNNDETSFYNHIRRYSTSVVMTSTYGRRIPSWQSEDVTEIYGLMKEFSEAAAPGAFIADMIPPLAEIIPVPLQWWRSRALRYQKRQTTIWMKYWNTLKEQIKEGKAPECFVKQFSESDYQEQGISEIQAAYVAGTMIEAGSETTSSALNSIIKFLAASPQVQIRARDELLKVVGRERTPTFEDEQSLPYIRAMGKEILRMRPPTNIGTPHYTTSDVIYKDMFIPKGTVVSISQYALQYDPSRYENPDTFDPARFLNHPLKAGAYTAHPDPYARDHFSFGAGRRICPGMHLAENSLFIVLAKILWAFDIHPPVDGDGTEEKMDLSDESNEEGVNTLPKPYRVRFIPRDEEAANIIHNEWRKAQEQGFYLGSVKVNTIGMMLDR
ncbi:hypothetical protein PVAG01_00221 [Phlyctema vagabunda]|uniref:O-methylsterigmatocystin oxidoreductase n=1 Tax=Phlyctema vagabunda TaxID=108571 RepID=A0ABR4PU82_9HELO